MAEQKVVVDTVGNAMDHRPASILSRARVGAALPLVTSRRRRRRRPCGCASSSQQAVGLQSCVVPLLQLLGQQRIIARVVDQCIYNVSVRCATQ